MNEGTKKTVFLMLEGWGHSSNWSHNSIKMNKLENYERLFMEYPSFLLKTELDEPAKYSSSVCNARISAGREIINDDLFLDNCIKSNLKDNKVFKEITNQCRDHGTALHLIGTVDRDEQFSSLNCIEQLLKNAKEQNVHKVYLHLIIKGKEKSKDIIPTINNVETLISRTGIGKISSFFGSDYVSSSGFNFKTNEIFKLLTMNRAEMALDPVVSINNYYKKGFYNNGLPATIITDQGRNPSKINDFDSIIFFDHIDRYADKIMLMFASSLLRKKANFPCYLKIAKLMENSINDSSIGKILFDREVVENTLPELLSGAGLTQLYLTENISSYQTTKGFSGFSNQPFSGSMWKIVPSVEESLFKSTPELSIGNIAQVAASEIIKSNFDFIMINLPNADLFSHMGSIKLAATAVLIIDKFLGYISKLCAKTGYALFIASDYGACEEINSTEKYRLNVHTKNPVPFIIVDDRLKNVNALSNVSDLIKIENDVFDIVPTILRYFEINKPLVMHGKSLIM